MKLHAFSRSKLPHRAVAYVDGEEVVVEEAISIEAVLGGIDDQIA